MAEALVSGAVKQLGSFLASELVKEARLLRSVEEEVEKLKSNLTAIQAVLADAETRQVMEIAIRDWLEKLRDVVYDIEDVLDDWEAGNLSSHDTPGDEWLQRKVCSFLWSLMTWIPCFCCEPFGLRYDIANKIKKLNERLDRIAQEKDRYQLVPREANPPTERIRSTSMIDIAEVKGREEEKDILVKWLLSEPSDDDGSKFRVLSIVGMGGIGKTTLAQYAFNDIKKEDYTKVWVCVSDPFEEVRVAKAILAGLGATIPPVIELEFLLQEIRKSMANKKFLLVLDDVWEENSTKWDRLKQSLSLALPGSKVLITTRNESVTLAIGCLRKNILFVKKMSDEQSWLIISRIAFFDGTHAQSKHLEEIGKKIASKCKGLPLAAKVVGGTLRLRKTIEQWQYILNSEIWEVKEGHVIPALWLSYNYLFPALKRCFSYCAIFSKNYRFNKDELIELWMAQGYLGQKKSDNLEVIGENYFQDLALHSFVQEFEYDKYDKEIIRWCKMHDMVHDLAQIVGGNEFGGVKVNNGQSAGSIIGVRHLRVDCTNNTSWFKSFNGTKKLRSLLIEGLGKNELSLTTGDLARLFSESTHLRSLRLKDGNFEEIPSSIGKLVHLRSLDLRGNRKLKHLDEALYKLHSLLTIDVSNCGRSMQLPHGIGKLINLRHLHNEDGPSRLPKGIAELTGLRTLEDVDVGYDDDDAFSLGDLKNLNQLRGLLRIRGLGARDRHVGEAKQVELKKREHITRLVLDFPGRGEERGTPRNEELLLEALEPSPNLKKLDIKCYRGTTFPDWMISLTNLRCIALLGCGCEHLPLLGKLPSLETLCLNGMMGVKEAGAELLRTEEIQISEGKNEISASASASTSSSSIFSLQVVAFPKFTELIFDYVESLEG